MFFLVPGHFVPAWPQLLFIHLEKKKLSLSLLREEGKLILISNFLKTGSPCHTWRVVEADGPLLSGLNLWWFLILYTFYILLEMIQVQSNALFCLCLWSSIVLDETILVYLFIYYLKKEDHVKKIASGERKNILKENFFTNFILSHTNLIKCFQFNTSMSVCLFYCI